MGDSSLHRFIMGNDSQKTALKAFNWISIVAGLVTIGAGVMGCVWGVKVLKPWPPLTWNNFVGGLFMIGFGFAIVWLAVQENGREKGFFRTYFAFLDHLLGRGLFFLFIGMRVIPLGKFYCLVAGIVIFLFGLDNICLHFKVKADDGNYSFCEECGPLIGDK